MYLVCVCCCWERGLSWYLLEYLLIQKHLWLLIDSICFVWVVCALQHGTEFMCKGRMAGQVPGQWESSLRTKTGTCWYPFKSQHAEALHEECSKIVRTTVPFGWGAGTSSPIACQQERYFSQLDIFTCVFLYIHIYFGFVGFGLLVWNERNVTILKHLGNVIIYPPHLTDAKQHPGRENDLTKFPQGGGGLYVWGKLPRLHRGFL